MLRKVLVVIALSPVFLGADSVSSPGAYTISISPPRIRMVPDKADLRRICRGDDILACTELLGARLACDCTRMGPRWKISAAAQFVPYMYISAPAYAGHEHLHLVDIRSDLEGYLSELVGREFSSARECRRAARFESTVFSSRLELLADISQERRR